MGRNPSKSVGSQMPVQNVSWAESIAFCQKLTQLEQRSSKLPKGWVYALPTEAQWEYSCRAGERGPYSGGTLGEVGWYKDNNLGFRPALVPAKSVQ